MIEMHDVIVYVLRTDHEIPYELGIGGNGDFQGVFDGAHRGDAVHQRADAADALRESPCIARVAAFEDNFDAAHHGAGARRARDHRAVEFRLDAQMALYASDGVDDDRTHGGVPARLPATSSSKLCGVLSQLKWALASSKVRRQSEQLVPKVRA